MDNTEQSKKIKEILHNLEFRGRMSLFYHEKRERFYNAVLDWTAFSSIIFSGAAFLFINNQNLFGLEIGAWVLGISALIVSTLNGASLAFGMIQKSNQHAIFRNKWIRFLGKVNAQKMSLEPDYKIINRLEKQFFDITEEEPSTSPKDVDWAYNQAIEAMGLKAP